MASCAISSLLYAMVKSSHLFCILRTSICEKSSCGIRAFLLLPVYRSLLELGCMSTRTPSREHRLISMEYSYLFLIFSYKGLNKLLDRIIYYSLIIYYFSLSLKNPTNSQQIEKYMIRHTELLGNFAT